MVEYGDGITCASSIERWCRAFTAQHEIPTESHQVWDPDRGGLQLEDQPLPRFFIAYAVEQQIDFVQGLARKEHLGNVSAHPAWPDDGKVNVWRPPPPIGL